MPLKKYVPIRSTPSGDPCTPQYALLGDGVPVGCGALPWAWWPWWWCRPGPVTVAVMLTEREGAAVEITGPVMVAVRVVSITSASLE